MVSVTHDGTNASLLVLGGCSGTDACLLVAGVLASNKECLLVQDFHPDTVASLVCQGVHSGTDASLHILGKHSGIDVSLLALIHTYLLRCPCRHWCLLTGSSCILSLIVFGICSATDLIYRPLIIII